MYLYLFILGKVEKGVEGEIKKLISNRDLVREKVEATGTVNYAVFRWLSDADKLIQDEEWKETSVLGIGLHYCFPCVLFPALHRSIYRDLYKTLNKIKTLNAKCEFDQFFNSIPGSSEYSYYSDPSSYFVCFESQKLASDQLLEALQDDSTSVIRLHGKLGAGKTQLVKAVAERIKYLKIFDQVGFATVSGDPDVRRIQGEMALSSSDFRNCRVLVILDDVRSKFVLESIGFPPLGTPCRSKVLMTTRTQREYTLMDGEREIPLHPLSQEEAWTLFKKHSGIDDNDNDNDEEKSTSSSSSSSSSSSDLLNVARQVAFACEGSLGTIINVGSSLENQPIEEWKSSLYALRHSTARYHIFLSFRGEDTRCSFMGFLYRALCQGEFKTFMDDGREGLHGGDLISPSLIQAIEASRLSIIVLSENYAHSSWCLDELVKILECAKLKNQLVLPIFYKVEPSDVRYQKNSFGEAMAKHQNTFGTDSEKITNWKSALFEVSNLPAGKAYKTGCEYEFIQEIVEDVNSNKRALYLHSMD